MLEEVAVRVKNCGKATLAADGQELLALLARLRDSSWQRSCLQSSDMTSNIFL